MTRIKFTHIVVIINTIILLNTTLTFSNNLLEVNKLKTTLIANNNTFLKLEKSEILVSNIEEDTIIQNVKTSETNTNISLNISQEEKEALIALYNSTDGNNWRNKTGWDVTNTNSVVTNWDENTQTGWYGVTIVNGKVTQLNLINNNLVGVIPSQIGQLTNLTGLNIGLNKLSGTIPSQIGLLVNLNSLNLSNNLLNGTIPSEISNLTDLNSIYLNMNSLTSNIPIEIVNLSNLKYLFLNDNKLTGAIPANIGQLSNLEELYLNDNQLSGSIPTSIVQLTNLKNLYLTNNQIRGFLPNEMSLLTKLSTIYIENNLLEGKIPNLTGLNLSRLNIQNNKFCFSDFASEYAAYISKLGVYFNYAPQSKTDFELTIPGPIGNSVNLIMFIDNRFTQNDTFQWYKGISPNGVLIPGATSRQYTISNLTESNAGTYYCLAQHPQITNPSRTKTNLVLERNSIHLNIINCPVITGIIKIDNDPTTPTTGYPFQFSATGHISSSEACAQTSFTNTFYAGSTSLAVNTQLYNDINLTTPVESANLWYKLSTDEISYRIDNSGKIVDTYDCSQDARSYWYRADDPVVSPQQDYVVYISVDGDERTAHLSREESGNPCEEIIARRIVRINRVSPCTPPAEPTNSYAFQFSNSGSNKLSVCNETSFPNTFYTNTQTLAIDTVLYSDQNLTTPLNNGEVWYKYLENATSYKINSSGKITLISSCGSGSDPGSGPGYAYQFSNPGRSSSSLACGQTSFTQTFYAATNTSILGMGTQLYTSSSLTTPVGSGNLWYKLADSGTAYRIDNNGQVAEAYNCTPISCNANVTANQYAQTISSGKAPTITLSSTTPGTTFSWTVAVQSGSILGAFAGSGNSINQVLTNIGTSNGTATYTITPTFNNCSGTPIIVVVTVKPASENPYARIIYEAVCRTGGCANSSDCGVQIRVELYNAPPTHTFTLTVTSNPESDYVLEMTRDYGTFYRLHYLEHVASHPPVYFTLTLKDSEGNIIYESEEELPSSSAWANTPLCN